MEDLKIGDIKTIGGVKRIVTGFVDVCGEIHPNTEPYTEETEEVEYKCQYCGKVCKNALGLASHEEHCKEKPQAE